MNQIELNKIAKLFTSTKGNFKISNACFNPKYSIIIISKNQEANRIQTKTIYIPKEDKVHLGHEINKSDSDIFLPNTSQSTIVITQDIDNYALIYEKFNTKLFGSYGCRIQIMEATRINNNEIYRIGKTILEIKGIDRNILEFFFYRSDLWEKIGPQNKKKTYKINKETLLVSKVYQPRSPGNYLGILERFFGNEFVRINKENDGWMIHPTNPRSSFVWKYLSSSKSRGKTNSPMHRLKIGQFIQLGDSRVVLKTLGIGN